MTDIGDFKIISHRVAGEIIINENSQYNDIDAERVTVLEGVTARLFGNVNHIIIKKDSKTFIHGKQSGKIVNEGGRLYIYEK